MKYTGFTTALLGVLSLSFFVWVIVDLPERKPSDEQVSKEIQQDVMSRAQAAVPAFQPQSFPSRTAINDHLKETEKPGVWYVYALAATGEPVFYLVSEHRAMNLCTSITSPERLVKGRRNSSLVLSAPSMTGVYHGGSNCNSFFVKDVTTGGVVELSGGMLTFLSSRHPLFLDTDVRRIQPLTEAKSG